MVGAGRVGSKLKLSPAKRRWEEVRENYGDSTVSSYRLPYSFPSCTATFSGGRLWSLDLRNKEP